MIDIHAHFAEEGYDLEAEWEKIRAAGVNTVVLAGDTIEHSRMHRDFANTHDGCYFTVGIHPEHAGNLTPSLGELSNVTPSLGELSNITPSFRRGAGGWPDDFLSLCREEKCVAVGEIGLDYHYDGYDKNAQWKLFALQLELANDYGLPLQIHSRDACADTLAILRDFQRVMKHGFLMHCYSYGAENLEAFLELGAYFSFGGVTCFKNARRAVEAVGACPKERLLSETDSPYLSPFRGEKNSPANIPVIMEKLADIKGMPFEEMQSVIRENATRLFAKLNN